MRLHIFEGEKLVSASLDEGETKIVLPNTITRINAHAFEDIENLEEIEIPSSVNCIHIDAFKNCHKLNKIYIPDSVKGLGDNIFAYCFNLKEVHLPKDLVMIPHAGFEHCYRLKEIEIPPLVESISDFAFFYCEDLEQVKLSPCLKSIGTRAFSGCENLKEIELPKSLKYMSAGAFQTCKSLEEIKIPSGVKKIDSCTFMDCHKLVKVEIPDTVKEIKDYAFNSCFRLRKINLPEGIEYIEAMTFYDCNHLQEIEIPKSVTFIHETSFWGTNSLRKIVLNSFKQLYEDGIENKTASDLEYYYINEKTNQILILKEPEDAIDGFNKIQYEDFWDFTRNCSVGETTILSLTFPKEVFEKLGNTKYTLTRMARFINEENYKELRYNILNNKEFNGLLKHICSEQTLKNSSLFGIELGDLFRLSYSLGAFSENQIERQRATEFIKNCFDKKIFNLDIIHEKFDPLKFNGFNKEWAEFLMDKNNFEELIRRENFVDGYANFISRIYNSFDDIKEYGRSNRGSQRYRKVTIDMADEFLSTVIFTGVDEDTSDIVKEISKYTHIQESFNKASNIRKEYLKLKESGRISDHILNEELKETREDIIKDTSEILENLNEISNKKFSYEFLSKYDPRNFVLGKYCSCCAHIEGMGVGIMKASIIHPDCQNLVIKDKEGRIIAKSTLYINRNQRYGVFNNVEINNNAIEQNDKEKIYLKYKEAVKRFAKRYNELNKDKPLTQINVGMNLNDLSSTLKKHERKSDKILKGIDFSEYEGYEGDWQDEQYVIWSDKKEGKMR